MHRDIKLGMSIYAVRIHDVVRSSERSKEDIRFQVYNKKGGHT